jgi:hypothetical protein
MTAVLSQDHVDDRGDVLLAHGQNGIRLALVTLPAGPSPDHAELTLHFFNTLHLADLLHDIDDEKVNVSQTFHLRGGTRLIAGRASGQVQVTNADEDDEHDPTRIKLTIKPVGDYSTYTLDLRWEGEAGRFDPFFSSIAFKFRPGCFTNDCAPTLPGRPAAPGPVIDYLARDYDSFRHTLMTAMAARVPGWKSTSEADHDQVLIDLFAAAADELADYQDRVMSEATLATARKRVSLARHARLVDYHLHEGNQATTWLVVEVLAGQAPFSLTDQELVVFAGIDPQSPEAVHFASHELRLPIEQRQRFDPLVNQLRLHTWGNAQPALAAGSTTADLVPPDGLATKADADALCNLIRGGLLRQLLIAERLNPFTGRTAGRNPTRRQLLRLLTGEEAAESIEDRIVGTWLVRAHWLAEDALRFDYSFTTFYSETADAPAVPFEDVSMFFGNLVPVHQGLPLAVDFHDASAALPTDSDTLVHRHYQRLDRNADGRDWVLAALPEGPLAYLPTPVDGETPARSTLIVEVSAPAAGNSAWDEVESLVHSGDSSEEGDHFMVETDERGRSVLRFGNGTNGRLLPDNAVVHARYQTGRGHAGNVGADQLTHLLPLTGLLSGAIVSTWNPFDVTDGRDPEPAEKIRRNAPEAFRARQLRAVTLADYVRRAQEVPGVSRAVARYAWTGSWRTVRMTIDPVGTIQLEDDLRRALAAHLEAVRLIGEDLELRPPRFVPLQIDIEVCAQPDFWREDLRYVLEQEFSAGWTSDGRPGFFHRDAWTFGQALHRSAIEGRIHLVAGVRHVVRILMKRFNAPTPGVPNLERLEMGSDEVVLLDNDPDHLERGLIRFAVTGGRQ